MATATKKIPPTSPPPPPGPGRKPSRSLVDRLVGVVEGIYRFLASLKLAVDVATGKDLPGAAALVQVRRRHLA